MMTKAQTFPNIPDAAETLSILQNSSVVRQAKAEKAQLIAEERKIAAQLREKLESQQEKEYLEMAAALDEQFKAVQAAEAALRDAKIAYGRLFGQQQGRKSNLDLQVNDLSAQLRRTCDPSISLFISDMLDELAYGLQQFRVSPEIVEQNSATGATRRRVESNAASVNARAKAIREAIDAAEQMKLEADQSKVPERLQEMRNGLPAVKL